MKYIVGFSQYNVELGNAKTREEKLNAYIDFLGGSQNAFNYLLNHLTFFDDFIKDATIIEENTSLETNNK